jgi:hypothetical protein
MPAMTMTGSSDLGATPDIASPAITTTGSNGFAIPAGHSTATPAGAAVIERSV